MENTLIQIIVQILIFGLLYFLIKNLFPAYFSEKGKNLATKQDIEEITEKIKSVEAKINIRTSSEIDYNSFRRKITLDFFGVYNHWERLVTLSEANYENDCEIKNELKIQRINEAKFNYNLKEGEIEVFFSDTEFYKLRTNLTIALLKIQQEFDIHIMRINHIIKNELNPDLKRQGRNAEIDRYNTFLIEKLKELKPLRNQLIAYLENDLKESFD